MPQSEQTRQSVITASTGADRRGTVQATVAARPVDFIPDTRGYYDPDLQGLITGLSAINPALEKYSKDAEEKDRAAANADRLAGTPLDNSKSRAYINAYNSMDGEVKGIQDANALVAGYQSEFNKDGTPQDLDKYLAEKRDTQIKGVQDNTYLESYNKALIPVLQKIRTDHLDYIRGQVVQRAEGNAMYIMDTAIRASLMGGKEVPEDTLDAARTKLGQMGIESGRFDDLLFESAKRIGAEGNDKVFDIFKRPRKDGSPGLYYVPGWKDKIDQAQVQASAQFFENARRADAQAQRDRENRQETALYDVFLEPDPVKATAMFREHVKNGLFTRASDLIKWEKNLAEKVDGKPDVEQSAIETDLLAGIYKGSVSQRQIISAQITNSQRRSLLTELRKTQHDNRTAAAAEVANGKAIYKTTEFRSGEDYIDNVLRPNASSLDPFGVGSAYDREQRASAKLEYTQRAANVKHPSELNAIRDEIVERYQKRRKETPDSAKGRPGAGLIRYSTKAEALAAYRRGDLPYEAMLIHQQYFEAQKAQGPK